MKIQTMTTAAKESTRMLHRWRQWARLLALPLALPLALTAPLSSWAATAVAGTPPTNNAETAFDTLQRQVTEGQFEAAYKLGKTMTASLGDPHFDFLFGVAAINVGRIPEGILALEHHLAAIPGNDRARLELARGYFELGDYVRAKAEFEFVLRFNPPKDVRTNIERYLDAMQTRDAFANRSSSRVFLETSAGRDSNVNAGTYNTQINLPTGPVVLADGTSRGVSSDFYGLTGGGQWVRRVTPAFAVFGGGDFDVKSNADAPHFDTTNLSAHAGFSMVTGSLLYRLTVSDAMMLVDQVRYRDVLSTTGELQYGLGEGLMLNGVLQYAEQAHSDANSIRDAKSLTWGGGFQKAFAGDWRPAVGLQVSLSTEDNLNRRQDLNRNTLTTRVFVAVNPTDKLGVSVSLAQQSSDFGAADIAFGTVREDELWLLDVGVSYALNRNWVLRTEVQWSDNASNQDLYAFRRTLSVVKVRYAF